MDIITHPCPNPDVTLINMKLVNEAQGDLKKKN